MTLASLSSDAEMVEPANLLDCHVIIIDYEDTETQIIELIRNRTRKLMIETHAFLDSTEADVLAALRDLEREVVNRGKEVGEMGVCILTAMMRS